MDVTILNVTARCIFTQNSFLEAPPFKARRKEMSALKR